MVKKILFISFWIFMVAGLIFLLGFTKSRADGQVCNSFRVILEPGSDNYMVDEDDVRQMFYEKGDTLVGKHLSYIDVNKIERTVLTNPWIQEAQAFVSLNGTLQIVIKQRVPMARIINRYGESFYLDTCGNVMLWSSKFTPRVPVALGEINEKYNIWYKVKMNDLLESDSLHYFTYLDELYKLMSFIRKDPFLNAQIDQVYINSNKTIELIPRIGKHRILFGTIENMEMKFKKLLVFYKQGLNYKDWNQYDTININFENQVVCSKIN